MKKQSIKPTISFLILLLNIIGYQINAQKTVNYESPTFKSAGGKIPTFINNINTPEELDSLPFINVLDELRSFSGLSEITVDSAKIGVLRKKLYFKPEGDEYKIKSQMQDGFPYTRFYFQGLIKPSITGILKICNVSPYNSGIGVDDEGNCEYVISNDTIKSISFNNTDKYRSNITISTNSGKLNIFSISEFIYSKKVKIQKRFLVGDGNSWMAMYPLNDNKNSKEFNFDGFELLMESFTSKTAEQLTAHGSFINENITDNKLTAENQKNLLTRINWTSFKDINGNIHPYHECTFKETDTTFILTKLIEVEKKRFYKESIINKSRKIETTFNKIGEVIKLTDSRQIEEFADHVSDYGKWSNFLVFSVSHIPNSVLYNTKVMIDNALLAEGDLEYKSKDKEDSKNDPFRFASILGELKTYAKNVNISKIYKEKLVLTLLDVRRNEKELNSSYRSNFFSNSETFYEYNFFKKIYIDRQPLAFSVLGTFDPKTKQFCDKTGDYLYQKIIFVENAKKSDSEIQLAYQYLPNGKIFDSINIKKNDFGEQIGKSELFTMPFSKIYSQRFNKAFEESMAKVDVLSLFYNTNESKKIEGYCSYCSKTFVNNQKGIITSMEFKCPNKNILTDVLYKFCSNLCYIGYQKALCEAD